MVYWTDPAGPSGATKALINDIDMTVNNGGSIEFPYILSVSESNTAVLNSPATKGVDHLNNMEQVVIDNPSSNLTVNLSGFSIPTGSQSYYITYEIIKDDITVTFPNGGDRLSTGKNYTIRWDALDNFGTFDIDFSADNGKSWNSVATGISGADRFLTDWSPNSNTNQGLIRVSRSGKSDVSDATFTSIGVPENTSFSWSCNGNAQLNWDTVNSATGYTVYQMGTKYMEPIGTTTTTTNFIVNIPTNSSDFFAVAANYKGDVGMRTIAFTKNAGSFGTCPNGVDLELTAITSPIKDGCLVGGTSNDVKITVSNRGSATINSFDIDYTFNGGNTISQNFNTPILAGRSQEITLTPITLPNNGQPVLNVSASTSGDIDLSNNTAQIALEMEQPAYGLPLSENFDNQNTCPTANNCEATTCSINSWLKNSGNDDIDWRVNNTETPSTNTGPADDRTGGGNYIYLEGSNCFGKMAILQSDCIELTASAKLSFYYNMLGSSVGELAVEIYEPSSATTTELWTISANQGTGWKKEEIDLSSFGGNTIQIIIKGNTGNSWETDIALDDILIESIDLTDLVISASDNSISLCDTLTIIGDGPNANNTYSWDFGNNAIPATATGKGPHKVYYTTTGNKTITLTGDGGINTTELVEVIAPTKVPSVSIDGTTIPTCTYGQFDFNLSGSNLGSTPVYEWFVNGNPKGSNSPNYSIFNPEQGDVISAIVTSSENCLQRDTAMANYTINQSEGLPHKLYISTTSFNENGLWQITNSSAQLVASNGNYVTNGDFEESEFCLVEDCYEFTFSNAFQGGTCNEPAWAAQAYPNTGTLVSHNGNLFRSKWYANPGDEPDPTLSGGATPWEYLGSCQQTINSDLFGVKSSDDVIDHLEVTVQEYTSPYTTNFCLGTITGSNEVVNNRNSVTVYPNPTSGSISVQVSALDQPTSYELFSINGQLLKEGKLTATTQDISLERLKSGVYIIKVSAAKLLYTERIIKK
jgi:hypothetical protein